MPPKKPVPTKAPTKPGGKTGTAPKAATNKAAVGGKKTGAPTKPSAAAGKCSVATVCGSGGARTG